MTVDARHIRNWLANEVLPLWSHAGLDTEAGGFAEKLTLHGRPLLDADKRMRVQARQIYVNTNAQV